MPARKILVADEDVDTRIILRTLLERHGYSVSEAGTADEAVATVTRSSFDLVILNHPMLTTSGQSLVHQLRTTLGGVPILNITSRVVPQFIRDATIEGVTMTLPKPIDIESVLAIIHDLTSHPLVYAV